MRRKSLVFSSILLLLVVASCSKFRKIEKNPDWRVKYEAGLSYYEKKDYYRSSILFESILPIIRGLPEAEKVQFYLAYCQYHEKLYLLASEQFLSFYETYGRGTLSEEARYMHAYSLFKSAPHFELDQTARKQAMEYMQEFINRYPNSQFHDQAAEVITNSQIVLEKKGFENARQYLKMRHYKASIIAFENFKNNFPDSKYHEESDYLMLLAQFELAEKSIISKQYERYSEVVDNYKEFIDQYPSSKFLKDAEKLYIQSTEKLSTLKKTNS